MAYKCTLATAAAHPDLSLSLREAAPPATALSSPARLLA